MKRCNIVLVLIFFCFCSVFILRSCKEADLPLVITSNITGITQSSAVSGGNIESDGGTEIVSRGICWSLESQPSIDDSKTNDGNGTGEFISTMTGLESGTMYFVRAYATNSSGIGYGGELSFTTKSSAGQTDRTYYVAASGGSDSNDGSFSTPWASLKHAVSHVHTGDTVFLLAGTHLINANVAVPTGVSLRGEGEKTVITSTSLTQEWNTPILSLVSSELSDGNQRISHLKFDGQSLTAAQAIEIKRRNNVEIHDCTFVDFRYVAVLWYGDGGFVGGDPYDEAYPPEKYATGNKFHHNLVSNCSAYTYFGYGALWLGGQEGMQIHDNSIIQKQRGSNQNGYCIKTYGGWMRGLKIFNNYLETAGNEWLFAIEGFFFMGCEIFNNEIIGAIDVNFSWKDNYAFGLNIHDNILGPPSASGTQYRGIILEFRVEDILISGNNFRNLGENIYHTMRYPYPWVKRERVFYNVFNCSGGAGHSVMRYGETQNNFTLEDIEFLNNVCYCQPGNTLYFGLHFRGFQSASNLRVMNNIFMNFGWYWFESNRGDYIENLKIQNNLLYNNANSNGILLGGTPKEYVNSGNIFSNPLFVGGSPYSFQLQGNSPGINSGLNVGLTKDIRGCPVPVSNNPDIGAYEYGSCDL